MTWLAGSRGDKRLHLVLTWAWLVIAVPGVLLWRDSIPFLVFVSVYANFVGHYSAYQAARGEVKQDVQAAGAARKE